MPRPFLTVPLIMTALAIPTASGTPDAPRLTPAAIVETEPVPSEGDAADDPAIWVHPSAPERSLILGTDKKGGLNVFDLDGRRLQVVSPGSRPNNVDVISGFRLGGKTVDLAVAGVRNGKKLGVAFWRIDPETRRLAEVAPIPSFPVFGGGEPYGSCVYRSPKDGSDSVFVSNKKGQVEQYLIAGGEDGTISARKVRELQVGSQVEGCVADPDQKLLFVAEEDEGIWAYGAEADSGTGRTRVARVGEHGLTADVEGLAIYRGAGTSGYLIASSQGSGTFSVYKRDGDRGFLATIDPRGGAIADVSETDGIDVTSLPTSPRFPRGLFVVQDGTLRDGHQNFKFFSWSDVAGDHLRIEPRRPE